MSYPDLEEGTLELFVTHRSGLPKSQPPCVAEQKDEEAKVLIVRIVDLREDLYGLLSNLNKPHVLPSLGLAAEETEQRSAEIICELLELAHDRLIEARVRQFVVLSEGYGLRWTTAIHGTGKVFRRAVSSSSTGYSWN